MLTVLKSKVLNFVQMARQSPTLAADPKTLKGLQEAVWDSVDGDFAATNAPVADRDWEVRDVLLGALTQNQRITMPFPYAVEIVGVNPVIEVLPTGPGGAVAPTLSSIDVQIDVNSQDILSSGQGNFGPSAALAAQTKDGTFVSLASIGVSSTSGNRLRRYKLTQGARDVGVTFKWKRGAGVYFDTIVSITFFCRKLSSAEIQSAPG